MSNFFSASLGACLGIGLLLLIYRKCERRLDSGAWSWMFGAFVFGLLYYLALQAVSYTHLDVYKRQRLPRAKGTGRRPCRPSPSTHPKKCLILGMLRHIYTEITHKVSTIIHFSFTP